MSKMNRLLICTAIGFVLVIVSVNVWFKGQSFEDKGREYRVSINRIDKAIEAYESKIGSAPESLEVLADFSGEEYRDINELRAVCINDLTADERECFFQTEQSDYAVLITDKYYYRISYDAGMNTGGHMMIMINVILIIVFVLAMALIIYVMRRFIKPFHTLTDMPYELSKGNLTVPLHENRDKAFGRFVWGMNLLRENIEENKERELALQRDKKVLLLSLSHDIKTPLSAIKLYSKALEKNLYKSDEKKQEIIANIGSKADEIESYISEIVKASNEDFLSFEVENREFYIKDVLERIRIYYYDKMMLNQIDFSMGEYGNCLVFGDNERLVEVIQNVIENAIKYGDGRRIWLEASRDEEEYTVCIRNTGCTMEKKELPHIFESFYRGSNVEKNPGSGLGLYICRQLLHLMEGEITAAIIEENGTSIMEVKVTIQLAK